MLCWDPRPGLALLRCHKWCVLERANLHHPHHDNVKKKPHHDDVKKHSRIHCHRSPTENASLDLEHEWVQIYSMYILLYILYMCILIYILHGTHVYTWVDLFNLFIYVLKYLFVFKIFIYLNIYLLLKYLFI